VIATCALVVLATFAVRGAEVDERALRAYQAHADRARRAFIDHVEDDRLRPLGHDPTLKAGTIVARAGSEDGIVSVPGGLVHHWMAAAFFPSTSLDEVLTLARDIDKYPTIYESIVSARVLDRGSHAADTMKVKLRIEERAGIISAILDLTSNVRYVRLDTYRAYSVTEAIEIREIADAGKPSERLLAPGQDHGYLWRAHTFARYIERVGGVYAELETLGLSRGFPSLLGWLIEPIARRLGRKSVEGSLKEFRVALDATRTAS
jgi:hypothetical protein